MNYNIFSKPTIYSTKPINSKSKLDTGTQCNMACTFCYYLGDLDKVTPFEIIKGRIDVIHRSNISEIELSGGESTIHKDWFKILDYCNERFERVSCLSNGYKLSDYSFAKKSMEHGLKEVLFSLHGYDEQSHNKIVNHNKAFSKILEAISNCQSLGIKVRINCTVTNENAEHLQTYTQLINEIKPVQLNYLPLNFWDKASNLSIQNYENLSSNIKQSIDKLNKDIEVNVRYIPFCEMLGYEKYVVGIFQHVHDLGDWNILTYNTRVPIINSIENAYAKALENRVATYYKPKECFSCSYFHICDGYEKQYKDIVVKPLPGDKIQDPMEYR